MKLPYLMQRRKDRIHYDEKENLNCFVFRRSHWEGHSEQLLYCLYSTSLDQQEISQSKFFLS